MSITAAEGFVAAGCHAGIKRRKFDMALIATESLQPVPCAAVFTQNKFAAPPVELDRATLAANGGKAAAIIVNSGNANTGTGKPGYKDAQLMAAATGEALQVANSHVLVCSTGIIGTPLPMEPTRCATTPCVSRRSSRSSSPRVAMMVASRWEAPKAAALGSAASTSSRRGVGRPAASDSSARMLPSWRSSGSASRGGRAARSAR